jgi:bacterioferritin-associated ferredoxin
MYICVCHAVTERQVRASVDAGARTLGDLQFDLGVATCCGQCAATAVEYLPGGQCASGLSQSPAAASPSGTVFPIFLAAAA